MKYRLHFLGFPHTATNKFHCHCAYTQKIRKALTMFSRHGHEVIHYGNEGSIVPDGVEQVQILTEAERANFYGALDKHRQYHLKWDPRDPSWQLFTQRLAPELLKRVKIGDFIMLITGAYMYQGALDQFPGCYSQPGTGPMAVEYGIGYEGPNSIYKVYESYPWMEWVHGKYGQKVGHFLEAVIPNYWDLDDFKAQPEAPSERLAALTKEPYYFFAGRINEDKGFRVAIQTCQAIGAKLILAGQGTAFGPLPPNVYYFGSAQIEEIVWLMGHAIATFAPTQYIEPFGGVSVEALLTGTPCITTDWGVYPTTMDEQWRCGTHQEFIDAAIRAQSLTPQDRLAIKAKAESLYGLDAVYKKYERYLNRLYSTWGQGYYQTQPLETINLPASMNVRIPQ